MAADLPPRPDHCPRGTGGWDTPAARVYGRVNARGCRGPGVRVPLTGTIAEIAAPRGR